MFSPLYSRQTHRRRRRNTHSREQSKSNNYPVFPSAPRCYVRVSVGAATAPCRKGERLILFPFAMRSSDWRLNKIKRHHWDTQVAMQALTSNIPSYYIIDILFFTDRILFFQHVLNAAVFVLSNLKGTSIYQTINGTFRLIEWCYYLFIVFTFNSYQFYKSRNYFKKLNFTQLALILQGTFNTVNTSIKMCFFKSD